MVLPSQRILFLLSFIFIAFCLFFGFYLEYFKHIEPCPLCILQRITLFLLGLIFLIGAIIPFKRRGNSALIGLALLISLLGIFLAGRQVWLQNIPHTADCSASFQYLMQVLTWDQLLAKVLQGTAECTQIGWEFLGLSLASWTLICFIFFFLLSLIEMFYPSKDR